jgi:hypothetical protein
MDPGVVNSETYVDAVRNSEDVDRQAIESYIKGAATEAGLSLQTSVETDAEAIAANPVGVFQTRLRDKAVGKLRENLALVDDLEKQFANTAPDSAEWEHLRNRVAPLIERDRKLMRELSASKEARDKLKNNGTWSSPITEEGTSHGGAEGPNEMAANALELVDERFLVPEDQVGIADNEGPAATRFEASVAVLDKRIAAMEAAHKGFIAEYPIAAAFHASENVPALESDASNEEIFGALQTGFFAEFRATVKETIDDVNSGDIDLHTLTVYIDETKKELGYDRNADANAAVDKWLEEEAAAERTREIVFTGVAIALTVAAFFATGGAALILGVLGAAAGMADAAFNLEKAADKEQLASAGEIGNEMVEDRDAARFEYWMAILGVALAAVDIAALKNVGKAALKNVKRRPPLSAETDEALSGKGGTAAKAAGKTAQVAGWTTETIGKALKLPDDIAKYVLDKALIYAKKLGPFFDRIGKLTRRAKSWLFGCSSPCVWDPDTLTFLMSRFVDEEIELLCTAANRTDLLQKKWFEKTLTVGGDLPKGYHWRGDNIARSPGKRKAGHAPLAFDSQTSKLTVSMAGERISNPSTMNQNYRAQVRERIEKKYKDQNLSPGQLDAKVAEEVGEHAVHHLIPDNVVQDHALGKAARKAGYDLDQGSNLQGLRKTRALTNKDAGDIGHWSSHPEYDKLVRKEMKAVQEALEKEFGSLNKVPKTRLLDEMKKIEETFRLRFEKGLVPIDPATGRLVEVSPEPVEDEEVKAYA